MRLKAFVLAIVILMLGTLILGACAAPAPTPAPAPAPTPAPAPAQAPEVKPYTIRYSIHKPITTGDGIVAQSYEKKFEEVTNGRLLLEVYPSCELIGSFSEALACTQADTADACYTSMGGHAKQVPISGGWPRLLVWRDTKGIAEAQENGLLDITEEELRILGYDNVGVIKKWISCGTENLASKKEIRVPDDLKGVTVMSPRGPQGPFMESCGAGGVMVEYGEYFETLQRGIADCCIQTLGTVFEIQLCEVLDYYMTFPFAAGGMCHIYSQKFLNERVPEDLRQTVLMMFESIGHAQALNRMLQNDYWLNTLMGRYMQTTTLTPEEIALWREKAEPALAEWVEENGELAERALEIMKKYNAVEE